MLFQTSSSPSDASHTGAGVSGTAGLSDYGVAFAQSLPKSMPAEPPKGFAVVSLFSGIDALRRALDILGLRPVRHIAVEIDSTATRNTWVDVDVSGYVIGFAVGRLLLSFCFVSCFVERDNCPRQSERVFAGV